jgi:hypothetical protein
VTRKKNRLLSFGSFKIVNEDLSVLILCIYCPHRFVGDGLARIACAVWPLWWAVTESIDMGKR